MFDQADLDFGIYRIMNAKRDEIMRFLDRDLLPQVREALVELEQTDRAGVEAELTKAIEQARTLGALCLKHCPRSRNYVSSSDRNRYRSSGKRSIFRSYSFFVGITAKAISYHYAGTRKASTQFPMKARK